LDTGTHLAELVRLFQYLHVESGLCEAVRGGQAADPTTDDDHIGHVNSSIDEYWT
jgi:hypothetical protein